MGRARIRAVASASRDCSSGACPERTARVVVRAGCSALAPPIAFTGRSACSGLLLFCLPVTSPPLDRPAAGLPCASEPHEASARLDQERLSAAHRPGGELAGEA